MRFNRRNYDDEFDDDEPVAKKRNVLSDLRNRGDQDLSPQQLRAIRAKIAQLEDQLSRGGQVFDNFEDMEDKNQGGGHRQIIPSKRRRQFQDFDENVYGGGRQRGRRNQDFGDEEMDQDEDRQQRGPTGRGQTNKRTDPRETLEKLDRKEAEEDLSGRQLGGIHGKRSQVQNELRRRGPGQDEDEYGDQDYRGRGQQRRNQNFDEEGGFGGRGRTKNPQQTLRKLDQKEEEEDLSDFQIRGIHGKRAQVQNQMRGQSGGRGSGQRRARNQDFDEDEDEDFSESEYVGRGRVKNPRAVLAKLDRREREEELSPPQIMGIHGKRAQVMNQINDGRGRERSASFDDTGVGRGRVKNPQEVLEHLDRREREDVSTPQIMGIHGKRAQVMNQLSGRSGREKSASFDDTGVGRGRVKNPREVLEKLDRKEQEEDLSYPQIMGIHGKRAQIRNQLRESRGRGFGDEEEGDRGRRVQRQRVPSGYRGQDEDYDDFGGGNRRSTSRRTTNKHKDPRETLEELDRKEEDLSPFPGVHGKRAQVQKRMRGDYDEEDEADYGGRGRGRQQNRRFGKQDFEEEDQDFRQYNRGQRNRGQGGRGQTNIRTDPRETLEKLDRKEEEEDLSNFQIRGIHGKRAQVENQMSGGGGQRRGGRSSGNTGVVKDYVDQEFGSLGPGRKWKDPHKTIEELDRREREEVLTPQQRLGIRGKRAQAEKQIKQTEDVEMDEGYNSNGSGRNSKQQQLRETLENLERREREEDLSPQQLMGIHGKKQQIKNRLRYQNEWVYDYEPIKQDFVQHTDPRETLRKLDQKERQGNLSERQKIGIKGQRAKALRQLRQNAEQYGLENEFEEDEDNNEEFRSTNKFTDPRDTLKKLDRKAQEEDLSPQQVMGIQGKIGQIRAEFEGNEDDEEEDSGLHGRTTNKKTDPRETFEKLDQKAKEKNLSAPQKMGIQGKRAQVRNQIQDNDDDEDYEPDEANDEDMEEEGGNPRQTNKRTDPRETLEKLDRKEREEDLSGQQIGGIHRKRSQVENQMSGQTGGRGGGQRGGNRDFDEDEGGSGGRGRTKNPRGTLEKLKYREQEEDLSPFQIMGIHGKRAQVQHQLQAAY